MNVLLLVFATFFQISWSNNADQKRSIEERIDSLYQNVESLKSGLDEEEIRTRTKATLTEADKVSRLIESGIKKDTMSWRLTYLKGRVYHAFVDVPIVQNAWDSAESCYQKALKLNPKYFEAHFALGNLYSGPLETMEKAVTEFQQAIISDSIKGRAQCHLSLSYAYLNLNKISLSESELVEHRKWNGDSETTMALQKILETRKKK